MMDLTAPGWRALRIEDALRAYPLVVAVDGAKLTLGRWRRMIRAWQVDDAGADRGGMVYVGAFATVLSLFLFRIDRRRAAPRCLLVPRVWLVELGGSRHVPRLTLAAIDSQAERCTCATVALDTQHRGVRWLTEVLALEQHGDRVARQGRLLLRRVGVGGPER
jgi:hypothetical protein